MSLTMIMNNLSSGSTQHLEIAAEFPIIYSAYLGGHMGNYAAFKCVIVTVMPQFVDTERRQAGDMLRAGDGTGWRQTCYQTATFLC